MDPYLFDKGAVAAVYHENVRRLPFLHFAIRVFFSTGVSFRGVDDWVTQLVVGVINVLRDRSTVWWDSKESLSVVIPFRYEEFVRDLLKR